MNPAAAVRGPKHVVTKGSTPVLSPAEARKLLDHIDTGTLAGLRESRGWLRLHEKGGRRHDVPAHHRATEALDEYLGGHGGVEDERVALSSERGPGAGADRATADASGRTGHDQAPRVGGGTAGRRRAATRSGRRGSRRTSRTGGTLEHAQQIAGHCVAQDDEALRPHAADTVTVDESNAS